MTLRRIALVTPLAVVVLVAACSRGGGGAGTLVPAATAPTPAPSVAGPSSQPSLGADGAPYPAGCPTAQPAPLGATETRTVTIETLQGGITIAVKGSLSPIATGNFVALASCGYYDGVVFHRVVPGFVIQGGDGQYGRTPTVVPDLVGTGGPPYTIQDEPVTTAYHRGIVAMARSSAPNSVGSQFFVVLDDQAAQSLADPRYNNYQIVGTVTQGMDAVDKIAAAADQENPTNPIPMTKVTVATP